MKWRAFAYLVLGSAMLAATVLVAVTLYRSDSQALPRWVEVVRPGTLSARHAFLGQNCEACHTPFRGVEATGWPFRAKIRL